MDPNIDFQIDACYLVLYKAYVSAMKIRIFPTIAKHIRLTCVIAGFAVIGILILISVKAAVTYVTSEAETGTTTGTYTGADTEASGDQYARFGASDNKGGGVTVSGNQLLRNGKPFLMRGFNMRGLLGFPKCDNKDAITAGQHFDETEMFAAKDSWKANTLRFQISQPGLSRPDLTTADYDDYVNNVIIPRVQLASSHGFVIILSMQTEQRACPLSGKGSSQPSQSTINSWNRLIPAVKAALSPAAFTNIVFEVFNEPNGGIGPKDWAQWQNGGDSPITPAQNDGEVAVGHQAVVNAIRSAGAGKNVIVAEGMRLGTKLTGMPMLTDPASGPDQLAYAFHGYRYADEGSVDTDRADWDTDFGFLAATKPVLMTEWHYGANDCKTYGETLAPTYLQYLQDKNIGISPGPFDDANAGGLIYDWKWTPTDCDLPDYKSKGGSGKLVRDDFIDQAAKEVR